MKNNITESNDSRQLIGRICVDTATCLIGDPCQILKHSWDEYLTTEPWTVGPVDEPFGEGNGFAISTGYGDGGYPVYIETTGYNDDDPLEINGHIKSITIEFLDDKGRAIWLNNVEDEEAADEAAFERGSSKH